MTSSRNATTYYIASGALSMVENALDNPNRIAVSITNGAAMLVHVSGVIDYAVDGNYRKWSITAYNTRLADTAGHTIYARLSRTTQQGMIIFSTREYDLNGSYDTGDGVTSPASQEYWFIPIGEVSATDSKAESLRELFLDFGLLSTDKGMTSSSDMFRVNPVTGMIEALRTFASATIQTLTVARNFILGGKSVTGIKGEADVQFDKDGWMIADGSSLVSDAGLKKALDTGYVSKLHDDTVNGKIEFKDDVTADKDISLGGRLSTKDFSPNVSGATFGRYGETRDTYFEIDRLYVRKIAEFVELQIQKLSHVGGQMELSPCASEIRSVEVLEDGSFKCYLLLDDGEDRITNDWVVGDQAKCQTFNVADNRNRYYWRLVTEVGEDYIVLSKTDCDISSMEPQAGDDIVQSGNRTDATRQNVIILSAHGSSSPSIAQYMGIDSYTLLDKEVMFMGYDDAVKAVVNRTYGNFYVGDKGRESYMRYSPDGGLEIVASKLSFHTNDGGVKNVSDIENELSDLGGFMIWQMDTNDEPTLENLPAVGWEGSYEEHRNDVYLTSDGRCWKFTDDSGAWAWASVTDRYLIAYLKRLAELETVMGEVKNSVDKKSEIFYHTSDPSKEWEADKYEQHKGDFWIVYNSDTKTDITYIWDGAKWEASTADFSGLADKIDGKSTIFTEQPNDYKKNDIWFLSEDRQIGSTLYKAKTILVSSKDNEGFDINDWSKKDFYTDGMNETEKQNLLDTGIDILNKEIILRADKTTIRSNNNTTIAMFTLKNNQPYFKTSLIDANEININVVKSYDKNGTLLSAYNGNGNGTIIYYYPNGEVMKEDVWLKDADGNTTGIRQIYYMANGEVAWYIDQNGFQSRLQEYWKDAGIWGFVLSVGYNEGGATIQQKAQAIASYVALHYSSWIPIEDTDNLSWWETYVGSTTYNEYQGIAIKGNIDSGEVPHAGMRGIFTGWALQGSVSGGRIYPYEFYLNDGETSYVGFYAIYYSGSRAQAYYYITTDGHVYDVPNSYMVR